MHHPLRPHVINIAFALLVFFIAILFIFGSQSSLAGKPGQATTITGIVEPPSRSQVEKDGLFRVTAQISCQGGDCEGVIAQIIVTPSTLEPIESKEQVIGTLYSDQGITAQWHVRARQSGSHHISVQTRSASARMSRSSTIVSVI